MRRVSVLVLMCCWAGSGPELYGQGGAGAGLAAAGASAVLGASGQGGTAPSSIASGGGGTAPIEVQILALKALDEIAAEFSNKVGRVKASCSKGFDEAVLNSQVSILQSDTAKLNRDLRQAPPNSAEIDRDRENMTVDVNKLVGLAPATSSCEVLIQDSTSSNQLALYQASQAYFTNLSRAWGQLRNAFALQVTPGSLSFPMDSGASNPPPQQVTITNSGAGPVTIQVVTQPDNTFQAAVGCPMNSIAVGAQCQITITFTPPGGTPVGTVKGRLEIKNDQSASVQIIQLSGEIKQVSPERARQREEIENRLRGLNLPEGAVDNMVQNFDAGGANAAVAPSAAAGGGGAAPTTPLGLTYLGDIMTALGGAKGTNTYASTSVQANTQALEIMIETKLNAQHIRAYTATSLLNLEDAVGAAQDSLTSQFANMLVWGNDISNWTNQCKPANGAASTPAAGGNASNSSCNDSSVIAQLSAAQQMINGYTTLLSTTNDGNGNPLIVDVLRGKILNDRLEQGDLSLQVAIVAAGGSSKTNSPFIAGLFYQWAPSYNGGAIATFELRESNNELLDSGARTVLYGYGKWNPGSFDYRTLEHAEECSFCSAK
jgi:hypothetical protein